jgi:hypothetical protein
MTRTVAGPAEAGGAIADRSDATRTPTGRRETRILRTVHLQSVHGIRRRGGKPCPLYNDRGVFGGNVAGAETPKKERGSIALLPSLAIKIST